ncbi:MAG: hypothetical protein NT031_19010 [Planctomycetota bacterium]|nr:hypothetical protein [Planctomycetota bacterium]
MTNEQTASKSRKDKLAKWIFLGVVAAGAVLVWRLQQDTPFLSEWEKDLPKALGEGVREHRPVLIFFHDVPPNQASLWLVKNHFYQPQSTAAYKQYNYIHVNVGVNDTASPIAQEWKVTGFPTLVFVDASGKEASRYTGSIPLSEFWERLKSAGEGTPARAPGQP